MTTITVEIQDKYVEEFISKLKEFRDKICDQEIDCIKVNNLAIEDYIKYYLIDSE